MTKPFTVHAWCVRPFISFLDEIQAETPDEAIAQARRQPERLLDAAEECNGQYPWDEFAAYDEHGKELLRVLDAEASLRDAAPVLLAACRLVVERWERGDLAEAARACQDAVATGAAPSIPPEPILIEVRGGVVQDVRHVPPGYEYVVLDHDDREESENTDSADARAELDDLPQTQTTDYGAERLRKAVPELLAFAARIARMTQDGEEVDGREFVIENDDAIATLHDLIDSARRLTAEAAGRAA